MKNLTMKKFTTQLAGCIRKGVSKMRIMKEERNISQIMALDNGDIFILNDYYYVTGEINMMDDYRECYNLSLNCLSKMRNNTVEYWHGENVKLLLSDKEC